MKNDPNGATGEAVPAPKFTAADVAALPNRYAMIVSGDSAELGYPEGSAVVFERDQEYASGDVVGTWFRPEACPSGSATMILRRLMMAPPSFVSFPFEIAEGSNGSPLIVVATDEPTRGQPYRCTSILAIHRCTGLLDRPAAGGLA